VPAVEHRVVAPSQTGGRAVAPEVVEQPGSFFCFVTERECPDLVGRFPVGAELLLEQLGVVREHAPRGLEDLARAAAVLVQDDGSLDAVVTGEPHQDVRVRPRPGEDRLLVVADRKQVVVRRREALQEVVLDRVHVLELVH